MLGDVWWRVRSLVDVVVAYSIVVYRCVFAYTIFRVSAGSLGESSYPLNHLTRRDLLLIFEGVPSLRVELSTWVVGWFLLMSGRVCAGSSHEIGRFGIDISKVSIL